MLSLFKFVAVSNYLQLEGLHLNFFQLEPIIFTALKANVIFDSNKKNIRKINKIARFWRKLHIYCCRIIT